MLSPLQHRVARIVAGLPEARDFALAGGAALIVLGKIDRRTHDLDFFGLNAEAVDLLAPVVEAALRSDGLVVRSVRQSHGFVRSIVESHDDRTELDLAADARLLPAVPGKPAPTLALEELAIDKVLAVFGRAEARDFVDLAALEPQFGLDQLLEMAREKDPGFRADIFVEMLDRFDRLRRDEFDVSDDRHAELNEVIRSWRRRAVDSAGQEPSIMGPAAEP